MREELISELARQFSACNRVRTFILFQQYMKGENLLMHNLVEHGGESTPSDIASELGISTPRVAAMLRSLELKKLVKRSASSEDKRKISVRITPKGEEWAGFANDEMLKLLNDFLDRVGENDAREFLRIMNKMLGVDASKEKPGEASNDAKPKEVSEA